MIGLAVLAGIAIYIAVWWLLVSSLKRTWAKAAAIVIALAIPFWDFPIGYYNFEHHCSTEGGLHVVGEFPPSTSVLVDPSTGYRPEDVLRHGFKLVEYADSGHVVQYSGAAGKLRKIMRDRPTSLAKIMFVQNQILPWNIVRNDIVAVRVSDNRELAKYTSFRWRGMWWQVRMAPMLRTGAACFVGREDPVLGALQRGVK